jgi:diguanylate cyclase (GGDEF)-like protein
VPKPELRRWPPLSGALARLEARREELAKAWILRVLSRASLDEIRQLPTDRIAAELPELISDVLTSAASNRDPFEMTPDALERAARLGELRDGEEPAAAELARDIAAIESVILEALRAEAAEMDPEEVGRLAGRVGEAVAAVGATAVEALVARRARELDARSNSDPLTGLFNLRHLERALHQSCDLAKRYEHPFALLMLDVDGLKRVNDAAGQAAGDRVLVQVALAVRRSIRSVDTPARIGADEFCVLAPLQTAATAAALARRLAEAVEAETARAGEETAVSVSIGVVASPEHGHDADALLEAADAAMYRAKAGGGPVAIGIAEDDAETEPQLEKTEP